MSNTEKIEIGHLEQFIGNSSAKWNGKFAAKNIRKDLKKYFKGKKFSVTSEFDCVRVQCKFSDPDVAAIWSIIGKYKTGKSDIQTDHFWSEPTPFNEVFGGVQYLFLSDMNHLCLPIPF